MGSLLLLFSVALLWLSCLADDNFCRSGFQVAARYHDCWQQAKFRNKYPDLYEPHDVLDATFLENYAIHMCSVVKPDALGCFKKQVKVCSNSAKLIGIANESGGACKGKSLSPFFKENVLNLLVPVTGNRESSCFTIGDKAYSNCYIAAARKVLESGMSDDIGRFHKVADLLFNTYWDCLTDAYKSQSHLCPNWQIPMLLVLQKTAIPNLFGMLLTPHQVAKLELQSPNAIQDNTAMTKPRREECEKKEVKTSYLVIQVVSEKPNVETNDNTLVLELSNLDGDEPELSMEGTQNDHKTKVTNFLNILSGPNTESSLKERQRKRKEEQEKNKALKNISRKLKGKDGRKKGKMGRKTKGRRKGRKKDLKKKKKKNRSRLNVNKMIQ